MPATLRMAFRVHEVVSRHLREEKLAGSIDAYACGPTPMIDAVLPILQGNGVEPDILVLDDPSKMMDGSDPQLDRAIEEMLSELKAHPFTPPARPKYPDRSGMGLDPKDK